MMMTRSDHNRCAPGEVLFILISELSLFDMINYFFLLYYRCKTFSTIIAYTSTHDGNTINFGNTVKVFI